jgi:hypothetical protein
MRNTEGISWPELPDCGVYLAWPEEGADWIHPDDLAAAEELIPSNRIFRRISFDGTYYLLRYGDRALRVKPTMWLRVQDEGIWIGDQVEIKGDFLSNEPSIAIVVDSRFDAGTGLIAYTLIQRDMILDKHYHADELVCLTKHPVKLLTRDEIRIEAEKSSDGKDLPRLQE